MRRGSHPTYTGLAVLLVVACATVQPAAALTDDCVSCLVGKYAANPGSSECTPCATGTYQNLPQQGACVPCIKGTSPTLNQSDFPLFQGDAGVVCGIEKISFVVLGSVNTAVSMFSGPNSTYWFHTAQATSVREILNSAPLLWTTGSTVRMKPATHEGSRLNDAILTRTTAESGGLWSPVNTMPLHTDDSAQYLFVVHARGAAG